MEPIAVDRPPALRELGPGDAPFPGTLRGGEAPTVWVDAAAFESSPAWRAADAEHVLRPIDLAQGEDGLQVLLPHCPVRVEAILGPEELSEGAAVTFAVSALRGALEANRLDAPVGSWWVTSDGRPVLALTGSTPWRDETVAMIREVADHTRPQLADILHRTAATISDPRLLIRESADIEGELFGVAAAEPLPTTPGDRAPAASVPRVRGTRRTEGVSRGIVHDALTRLVDGSFAERISAAVAAVVPLRTTSRPSPQPVRAPRRRRRALIPAAVAASIVVGVGLWWPAGEEELSAEASGGRVGASAEPDATPSPARLDRATAAPSPAPAPDDTGSPELIAVTRSLLDSCGDDACPDRWEDAAAAAAVDAARGDYRVEVVDEYGGVAAVRVTGRDRTQVVVIVESGERWLIRDIYELADEES